MGDVTLALSARPHGDLEADASAERAIRIRAIVAANFDFVWRLLRRLGVQGADVDDAAQRVFIVTTGKLDKVRVGSERTFLFGTALRIASAARRDAGRRREDIGADLESQADPGRPPDESAERRQGLALLDAALDRMSEELRVVFILSELEELTDPEIARMQGIPVGTVASRLRRARKEFQESVRRVLSQKQAGRRGS